MEAEGNIKLGRCEGDVDWEKGSRCRKPGVFQEGCGSDASRTLLLCRRQPLGCVLSLAAVLNLWVKTLPRGAYWIPYTADVHVRIPNSRKIMAMK